MWENTWMTPTEEKLPPRQYMELLVQKIQYVYGLPGSGQQEREATCSNINLFYHSDVLQNPEAQDELIGLLPDTIAAGCWDVFSAIVLTTMLDDDKTWARHPIAVILNESPSCRTAFKTKVLDRLPREWRRKLDDFRYIVDPMSWHDERYGIFCGWIPSMT
jgi:hypothetical protein